MDVSEPPPGEMRERVIVQRAFFHALGTQFVPQDPDACVDKRLVSVLLCRDGLRMVIDTLSADGRAKSTLWEWRRSCRAEYCRVENDFVDLVDNPMAASTRMVDDIAYRLAWVEERMKTSSSAQGGDYLKPVLGARWLFEATHLRSRPRRDWFPGSVPGSNRASWLPISSIGANLGTAGVEGRYSPTYNARWGFVRLNGILHYNGEPVSSEDRTYGGVGLGVGLYSSTIAVSEFGIGVNRFRGLDGFTDRAPAPREVEIHGVFVANQLRVGLRWLPDGDHLGLLHGRRGWALSAGLNDPVGLVYWITRIGS